MHDDPPAAGAESAVLLHRDHIPVGAAYRLARPSRRRAGPARRHAPMPSLPESGGRRIRRHRRSRCGFAGRLLVAHVRQSAGRIMGDAQEIRGKPAAPPRRARDLICAFEQYLSFPRRVSARVGPCFADPDRGGRSADRRIVSFVALASATRPMTRDARLSALPPWRFTAGGRASVCSISSAARAASSSQPGRSAWRAGPRTSRGAVTSRSRRTPIPAPPSGSSLEDAPR